MDFIVSYKKLERICWKCDI